MATDNDSLIARIKAYWSRRGHHVTMGVTNTDGIDSVWSDMVNGYPRDKAAAGAREPSNTITIRRISSDARGGLFHDY